MVIDTHVDHGEHRHELSERVVFKGYDGRLYRETGRAAVTASFGNLRSFWPTLESFRRMVFHCGFTALLTADPWHAPDRTIFVARP